MSTRSLWDRLPGRNQFLDHSLPLEFGTAARPHTGLRAAWPLALVVLLLTAAVAGAAVLVGGGSPGSGLTVPPVSSASFAETATSTPVLPEATPAGGQEPNPAAGPPQGAATAGGGTAAPRAATTTTDADTSPATASAGAGATGSPSLLYAADWSRGLDGWTGPGHWSSVGGMLVNDGGDSGGTAPLLAPVRPGSADYAVQAEIQFVRYEGNLFFTAARGFGLSLRLVGDAGLRVGHYASCGLLQMGGARTEDPSGASYGLFGSNAGDSFSQGIIAEEFYRPDARWHTYRIEARGNHYTVQVDGRTLLDFVDNTYLEPGRVGLWSDGSQLNVRAFKVEAL